MVGSLNDLIQTRLFNAKVIKECLLFILIKAGQFFFHLGTDGNAGRTFFVRKCLDSLIVLVGCRIPDFFIRHIGNIDHRLACQQAIVLQIQPVILIQIQQTDRLALFQCFLEAGQRIHLLHRFLILGLCLLGNLANAVLHGIKICQAEFHVNLINITDRIHTALDMLNIVIIEASDYMHNGIRLTNAGKELVAKTFTLGSTLDKTRNIREFKCRINCLARMEHVNKVIHSLIRHFHHTDIRLNGRKWIILRQHLAVCNCIEQR